MVMKFRKFLDKGRGRVPGKEGASRGHWNQTVITNCAISCNILVFTVIGYYTQ